MSVLERFYYQIHGPEGASPEIPKLVFLHGVMGYAANWRRISKAFESDYQILAYDQRGHGRSYHPDNGYAPEDYAGDLEAILDELGWERVHLVGHSMGGRVALTFAANYPSRVAKLVIEDIGPEMQPAASSLVIRMLDTVPVPFPSKREAKEWFDTEFMRIFAAEPNRAALAAYLYANITENENKEAVWRFSEKGVRESVILGRATDRWAEVQRLSMPTLLVRGELSKDLPRELFEKVVETNPHIEGVEIKGAGHWVHSEQPEVFISVLERFFRGELQVASPNTEPWSPRRSL